MSARYQMQELDSGPLGRANEMSEITTRFEQAQIELAKAEEEMTYAEDLLNRAGDAASRGSKLLPMGDEVPAYPFFAKTNPGAYSDGITLVTGRIDFYCTFGDIGYTDGWMYWG